MVSAKTERDVLIEYPIDVAYDTLVYLFPVRHFRLANNDENTHSLTVEDASNFAFIMHIFLRQNTANTTIVHFIADYPHALMDISNGGGKAIDKVLGEYLNELSKKPKPDYNAEDKAAMENNNVEKADAQNYANATQDKPNTKAIAIGYVLAVLSIILPFMAIAINKPRSSLSAFLIIGAILCLTFLIVVATILIYDYNKKSVMHGRIQICICGLLFILAGLLLTPALTIVGILIPAIILIYSFLRGKNDVKY